MHAMGPTVYKYMNAHTDTHMIKIIDLLAIVNARLKNKK